MSRKPSPATAKVVVAKLARIAEVTALLDKLEPELVALLQKDKALKEELATLQRDLREEIVAVDCASAGNWGWEGRISYLLGEVFKILTASESGKGVADCSLQEERSEEEDRSL